MPRVVYKDTGWMEIQSQVAKLGSSRVEVGVLGEDADQIEPGSNITVGEVALIQEYGTSTIPPRPFVGTTFKEYSNAALSWLVEAAREATRGRPTMPTLKKVGAFLRDAVRQTVLDGVDPPNAAVTVQKKGHAHTLIDSGTMAAAITYRVVQQPVNDDSSEIRSIGRTLLEDWEHLAVDSEGNQ